MGDARSCKVANLKGVGSASAEVEPRFDWFETLECRVESVSVWFPLRAWTPEVHEGRLVSGRPDEPANLGGDEGQESSGSSIRPLVCGVSDTEPEQSSEVRRGEAPRGR